MNHTYYNIEPTHDFATRTMARIQAVNRRKYIIQSTAIIVIAFSPVLVRELWLAMRHDYFSVARMPMGGLIAHGYHIFLAPSMRYLFITFAISATAVFIIRSRKEPTISLRFH